MIREIDCKKITETVAELCIKANKTLPDDISDRLKFAAETETNPLAKNVLGDLIRNSEVAATEDLPVCQDTGMAVVFLDIGQDVHITGGDLYDAVNKGVHDGYVGGLLRCSVVGDPLRRVNTGDNTPAVIHTRIVKGDKIGITVAPKGFGSENMSFIKMLTPFDSREGVINAVIEAVKTAGNNPCPPIIVGVGIGGDFEQCAYLSKVALLKDCNTKNSDPYYAEMEEELLEKINKLPIGAQGFGGNTTALKVNIVTAPTHIAGLPVAVNIGCHVTRHAYSEVM